MLEPVVTTDIARVLAPVKASRSRGGLRPALTGPGCARWRRDDVGDGNERAAFGESSGNEQEEKDGRTNTESRHQILVETRGKTEALLAKKGKLK